MANEYYVNSATGSDANDGSSGAPWATLDHASANLTLPAIIHATGAFTVSTWSATSTSQTNWLRIEGDSREETSITTAISQTFLGTGRTLKSLSFYADSNSFSPNGFTFDDCFIGRGPGSTNHYFYGIGSATFLNCTVDYGANYGQFRCQSNVLIDNCDLIGDIRFQSVTGSLVINRCTIRDNSSFASMVGGQGGMIVVDHCTFADSNDASAVFTLTGGHLELTNSVFVRVGDSIARTVVGTEVEIGTIAGNYIYSVPDFGSAEGYRRHESPIVLNDDPFPDSATGVFVPSDELAAIVGSDGLTPGHVQADGGGSSSHNPFLSRAFGSRA